MKTNNTTKEIKMICMQAKGKEQVTLHQTDIDNYELEIFNNNGSTKAQLTEQQVNALAERIAKYNDLKL